MRLLRLELRKFGPFEGKTLEFHPEAKLHIVYGLNEKGKTTALRAIGDLLFGIGRQFPYKNWHSDSEARLGGLLRNEKGEELLFERKKNKHALTNDTGGALSEEALAPYLEGLSRDVFERAFGLDAAALRKSAEEVKQQDGELGAALFAAAAGLRGLTEIQQELKEKSDGFLGKTRAKNRLFDQAFSRFEAARKNLRDAETRGEDLKKSRKDIEQLQETLDACNARRLKNLADLQKIERLRRVRPTLLRITDLETTLAGFSDAPEVPDGFVHDLQSILKTAEDARLKDQAARMRVDRFQQELEAIFLDPRILDKQHEIDRQIEALGQYRTERGDVPRVSAELTHDLEKLHRLACRLGFPATDQGVANLCAQQPDDPTRARFAHLAGQGRILRQECDSLQKRRAKEEKDLAGKRARTLQRPPMSDPRPLRELFASLSDVVDAARRMEDMERAFSLDEQKLREAAQRLTPSIEDFEKLATSPLPSRETIAHFQIAISDVEGRSRTETQVLRSIQKELAICQSRLEDLATGGPVPSRERILALRAERNADWICLRSLLKRETEADQKHIFQKIENFEDHIAAADHVADDAARDAARVAEHAQTVLHLARKTEEMRVSQAALSVIEQECQTLLSDWRALWRPSDIIPLTPQEMLGWRAAAEGFVEKRDILLEKQRDIQCAQEKIAQAQPRAETLAHALDLALEPLSASFAARMENHLTKRFDAWEAQRNDALLLAEAERQAMQTQKEHEEAQNLLAQWRKDFDTVAPRLSLSPGISIEEAQAALEVWRDLPAIVESRASLEARIAGMRRNMDHYRLETAALMREIAPDQERKDPEEAIFALKKTLQEMRRRQTQKQDIERRLVEGRQEAVATAQILAENETRLKMCAERLTMTDIQDLSMLAVQLQHREETRTALRKERETLRQAGDGIEEAALRADCAAFDSEEAEEKAILLKDERQRIENEKEKALVEKSRLEDELGKLDAFVDAEIAEQNRQCAYVDMQEAAEQWLTLKIAAEMIGAAMRRQRENRREPLLQRASAYFEQLTGGLYQGLEQEFDESDAPILIGRRGDTVRPVAVSHMSEGARDQFCLALRLAYLENYAEKTEAPPFICDDLFSSFDDERTACGLRALAALGDRVQPILFTHHESVREIARRLFPQGLDIMEL